MLFYGVEECLVNKKRVAALGFFDGVHLGHQRILLETKKACANGAEPCVFTYRIKNKMPNSKNGKAMLTTYEEKVNKIKKLGINCIFAPYFEEFADLTADEFVEKFLVDIVNAEAVVCGENFKFGKNRSYDVADLRRVCKNYDIKVISVPLLKIGHQIISSSLIRNLIKEGNETLAFRLLDIATGKEKDF